MISIFRSKYDGGPINYFHGRDEIEADEVVVLEKKVFGEVYRYAEPAQKGRWAFGGTILFTSNGIYPQFTTPIKLHDRNMDIEGR